MSSSGRSGFGETWPILTAYGEPLDVVVQLVGPEHLVLWLENLASLETQDVRMRRLDEVVEQVGVKPDWREGLEPAQAAYEARNELTGIQVQVPDEPPAESPTWIRPREAFELWAYGEVIHDDYPKVLRWQKLGPPGQGLVRQMAYDYLTILLEQAAFIRRVITHGLEWSWPGFVDGEPVGAPGDLLG